MGRQKMYYIKGPGKKLSPSEKRARNEEKLRAKFRRATEPLSSSTDSFVAKILAELREPPKE